MDRRNILMLGLGSLSAATMGWRPARAQAAYPQRPIRLIVPRSAGGVLDVIGRHWAEWATLQFGQGVVVENQGGGGGITGTAAAAHATADGYTLLLGSTSDLVLNPVLSSASLYDPSRISHRLPLSRFRLRQSSSIRRAGANSQGARGLRQGQSRQAVLPVRSRQLWRDLCASFHKTLAGTPDIVHILQGRGGGYSDLLAGHIPIMAVNVTGTMLEMHREGRVRILAIATDHHLKAAPDIPTAAEAGYPDLIAQLFVGVFAPAKTPEPIVTRLAQMTAGALADKKFQGKLEAAGFEPLPGFGPEKTATYIKEEIVRWTPILKESGMKPE